MAKRLRTSFELVVSRWRWFLILAVYKIVEDWGLGKFTGFLDRHSGRAVDIGEQLTAALPWITWAVIPFLLVAIVAHAYIESRIPTALRELATEATEISQRIFIFLGERNPYPTDTMDREAGWQSRIMEESRRFMADYDRQFGATVVRLHDELKKAGIEADRLEQFYDHPTNPLGIREVALALGAIGERIIRRQGSGMEAYQPKLGSIECP